MSLRCVRGQDGAVAYLTAELRSGRVKHAYLFHGVKGVGKKYTAVQFAQALLCEAPAEGDACDSCESCRRTADGTHPDVITVDFEFQAALLRERTADQRSIGIETVREMQRLAALTGYRARRKVFIVDAAETMQETAANSLLKTLEEPPGACTFILVSAGTGDLPRTIVSRCALVPFKPLDTQTLRACVSAAGGEEVDDDLLHAAHGSLQRLEALRELGAERSPAVLLRMPPAARSAVLDSLVRQHRDAARQLVYCLAEYGIRNAGHLPVERAVQAAEALLGYIRALRANVDTRVLLETMLAQWELLWNGK